MNPLKKSILDMLSKLIQEAPEGIKQKSFPNLPCLGCARCGDYRRSGKTACRDCSDARNEYGAYMAASFDMVEFNINSTTYRVRLEEHFLKSVREAIKRLPDECFEIKDFI